MEKIGAYIGEVVDPVTNKTEYRLSRSYAYVEKCKRILFETFSKEERHIVCDHHQTSIKEFNHRAKDMLDHNEETQE